MIHLTSYQCTFVISSLIHDIVFFVINLLIIIALVIKIIQFCITETSTTVANKHTPITNTFKRNNSRYSSIIIWCHFYFEPSSADGLADLRLGLLDRSVVDQSRYLKHHTWTPLRNKRRKVELAFVRRK